MNVHDCRFLLSEQETLKKLISQTSPGNVIGRMSLQSRLQQVEKEFAAYQELSPRLVNARLTFRGLPVVDSRGIWVDFGGDIMKDFAEAITVVGASQRAALPIIGRIPGWADFRSMITGTASGSFGFQIEDASQQPAFAGESTPVELAIERVKEILEASVGIDEQLVDAIADTDRRALNGVQKFLKTMADNSAKCALEFRGEEFRFRDVAQVRRSESRLSDDNIQEDDVALAGQFQGFLPHSRRAEFLLSRADAEFLQEAIGTIVSGRVEPAVDDTVDINQILNRDVTISARTKRVGQGRPRYVITGCQAPT